MMSAIQIGAIVDERFKILRSLGEGGMGSVFLVEQLHMDRVCAIKFLHEDLAQDRDYLLRFEREARILSELVHPNITRFFCYGVYGENIPYFAMEYVEGKTLKDLMLSEKRLSWRRALCIAGQVVEALAASHSHGVVHRDLSRPMSFSSSKRDSTW